MRTRLLLSTALTAAVLTLAPISSGHAEQRSFNAVVADTLEQIDRRSSAFESGSAGARADLERLAARISEQSQRLAKADDAERRRALRARVTRDAAEYVKTAAELLDDAIEVVGKNLVDLQELTEAARRSRDDGASAEEENIAAGKAMREALVELTRWASEDPVFECPPHPLNASPRLLDVMRRLRSSVNILGLATSTQNTHPADEPAPLKQQISIAKLDWAISILADQYDALNAERQALQCLMHDALRRLPEATPTKTEEN